MIIYPEITIEWAGEEYSVTPTFRVINKIEQSVNLATIGSSTMNDGAPRLSNLAVIYAALLNSVGVNVGADEVYAAMYGANDGAGLTQAEIIQASAEVVAALIPRNAPKEKSAKKKASQK